MIDAPLAAFTPKPHHAYYMHVATAPNGSGCGLTLVRAGSGRLPCYGVDCDSEDDYLGDVLTSLEGLPLRDITVQYFRSRNGRTSMAINGNDWEFIQETTTDRKGRHELRLEPGIYAYRYLGKADQELSSFGAQTHIVAVEAGRMVSWQDADGEEMQREIGFVTEDLICDWNTDDGEMFSWQDIEETIYRIHDKCQREADGITQISFSHFLRPDVIANLQRRGVPAVDLRWTDQNLFSAYHNFGAMAEAEALEMKTDTPASSRRAMQISNVRYEGKKAVNRQLGRPLYLAEATVVPIFFAALEAAHSPHGAALPFWCPGAPVESESGALGTVIEEFRLFGEQRTHWI